jgi:proteasome component ECM29
VTADTNAAARLFAALASEPAGARAAVAEASGALCAAYATATSPFLKDELLALVSAAAASPSDGVRAAAVRWARGLFPFASAPARYVCIVAAGDAKLEVREEGMRGLAAVLPAPPPLVAAAAAAPPPPPDPATRHPPLEAMLTTLAGAHPRLARAAGALAAGGAAAAASVDAPPPPGSGSAAAAAAASASSQTLLLPARGYAAAVSFLRDCRAAERRAATTAAPAAAASPEALLAPPLYRAFMEAALARDAPAELWIAALAALLDAAADAPAAAAVAYAPRASWLRTMLSHTDSGVREMAGQLLSFAAAGMASDAAAQLLASLAAIAAGGAGVPGGASGGNVRHEEADGATAAVGYILAQAAAGAPTLPVDVAAAAAASLLTAAGGTDEALCASAAAALGHAGLRAPLPLPEGEAPAEAAPPSPGTSAAAAAAAAAAVVIPPTRAGVATRVALLLKSKDPKTVVRAARAAGHFAAGDAACAPLVAPLTAALLACGTIKTPTTEAVTFSVGDALAAAFAGLTPSAIDAELRRGGTAGARAAPGAEADASADDDDEEEDGGDAMDAEADAAATAAAAAAAAACEAPARAAAQAAILSTLLGPLATSSRPAERCAAAVWLLSLVGAAGADTAASSSSPAAAMRPRCHPALAPRLAECQEAFSYLLGDANEVTQDCASRGLSLVYRRGDAATRKALVGGLVATLSGDKAPAKRAVKARGACSCDAGAATSSARSVLMRCACCLFPPSLVRAADGRHGGVRRRHAGRGARQRRRRRPLHIQGTHTHPQIHAHMLTSCSQHSMLTAHISPVAAVCSRPRRSCARWRLTWVSLTWCIASWTWRTTRARSAPSAAPRSASPASRAVPAPRWRRTWACWSQNCTACCMIPTRAWLTRHPPFGARSCRTRAPHWMSTSMPSYASCCATWAAACGAAARRPPARWRMRSRGAAGRSWRRTLAMCGT